MSEYTSHSDEMKFVTERLRLLLKDAMINYEAYAWFRDDDEDKVISSYWKLKIKHYSHLLELIYSDDA